MSERLQLAQDIWYSVAAEPDSLPLTAPQRQELDRRLESYRVDRDAGASWIEVKRRLWEGK